MRNKEDIKTLSQGCAALIGTIILTIVCLAIKIGIIVGIVLLCYYAWHETFGKGNPAPIPVQTINAEENK